MVPKRFDRYLYCVTWSDTSDEFVGLCLEFPSLSWFAASPKEALIGIRQAVIDSLDVMDSFGNTSPEPYKQRELLPVIQSLELLPVIQVIENILTV